MITDTARLANLSDAQRREMQGWLDEFAREWAAGKLAEYVAHRLPKDLPLRTPALREFIKIDLERHWQNKNPVQLESYLDQFPELGTPSTVRSELIEAEYEVRQRCGAVPAFAELAQRFPHHIFEILKFMGTQVSERATMEASQTIVPDGPSSAAAEAASGEAEMRAPRPRYTRLRIHAQGGLGCVWAARDEDLGRTVALKELQPSQVRDADARRRFVKEAQVTGQLEHPNIVPVYEMNSHEGQPFYAMRLIQGRTLRQALSEYHEHRRAGKAEVLELPRLLNVFVSMCQALAFAHSRGVVHRDLKPANVVLGDFGEVIVLDWGLAKVVGDPASRGASVWISEPTEPDATVVGSLLGTPAYMAPEQAEGAVEQIEPRTDIYGLGAILFEILTGRPPHQGKDTVEVVRRIMIDPTPIARDVEPKTPRALNAICAKAMAKTRQNRYASAAALAEDVQRYLADQPVSVYAEYWPQRLARWARRHKTWAVSLAAALLVGILTMSWAAWQQNRMAGQERRARVEAEMAQEQGLRMAAKFAARSVAGEIKLRWQVLDSEADDPALRAWLVKLHGIAQPLADPDCAKLQGWLLVKHKEYSLSTKAASWVVVDRDGLLLARSPVDKELKVVGRNWASRDFFHGQGKTFPDDARPAPIKHSHLSRVFESKATFTRMTAFSVPIWSDNSKKQILGLLAMTVELSHFAALQIGQNQVAVLVDTRADGVEDKDQRGLLLHHPRLVELHESQPKEKPPPYRLDPDWLPRLAILQKEARAHFHDPGKAVSRPESWEPNYQDPVGGPYAGRSRAALEPVIVQGRTGRVDDTGWVVIIQERGAGREATGEGRK